MFLFKKKSKKGGGGGTSPSGPRPLDPPLLKGSFQGYKVHWSSLRQNSIDCITILVLLIQKTLLKWHY